MEDRRDVLVIGAGVFGLSVAEACVARGMAVTVLDADRPGAGASGGIVGALSPHAPDRWTRKKQFQFDALAGAGAHWSRIAGAGGVDPGFSRCGRLIPLATEAARAAAMARADAAAARWGDAAAWRVRDGGTDWLAGDAAPFGHVHETLSARIAPRRALAALAAAIRAGGGRIESGIPVTGVADGGVRTRAGTYRARHVVVAAGTGTGGLLAPLLGRALGRGVKGQAALLSVGGAAGQPMIFADGVYVVPHADGTVAVGSTSETEYGSPDETDGQLDTLIARARALCPALRTAPTVECWAGLRPRAGRPDPMLGPVPGANGVWVAAGGFKIGFGIAPAVGSTLAAMIGGADAKLPDSFAVQAHLAAPAAQGTGR